MEGERNQNDMFIKKYSESNPIYRESVIPAIKVFRESMDKNTLILPAIYRTLCIYTNLRVFSGYPNVVFVKYLIEKRKSVCRSNGFYRTSARTLPFTNYSDGAKYKGGKKLFF